MTYLALVYIGYKNGSDLKPVNGVWHGKQILVAKTENDLLSIIQNSDTYLLRKIQSREIHRDYGDIDKPKGCSIGVIRRQDLEYRVFTPYNLPDAETIYELL